MILKYFGKVF